MGEGQTVYEALVNKFHYIQEEKLFFKAAFKNDTQNCLRDHDFELIREFYKNQIEEKSGKTMSEHLQFQLEMYCQGSIYMTVQWVLGEMKENSGKSCTCTGTVHAGRIGKSISGAGDVVKFVVVGVQNIATAGSVSDRRASISTLVRCIAVQAPLYLSPLQQLVTGTWKHSCRGTPVYVP